MKTEEILLLVAGAIVLFILWRRMNPAVAAVPVATATGGGIGNPLAALPGVVSSVGNTANAAVSTASSAVSTGLSSAGSIAKKGAVLGVKIAAAPITLGLSAAKGVVSGAVGVGKTIVHDLNPFNW
jgi:hypothetical protein